MDCQLFVAKLFYIGSGNGLSSFSHQANTRTNECWLIAIWTLGNKVQWNLTQNTIISSQEHVFENIIGKMCNLRPIYLLTKPFPLFSELHTVHPVVRVRPADVDGKSLHLCLWLLQCSHHPGILQKLLHAAWGRHPGEHVVNHYSDVIMIAMASQITSLTIVYLTVCWGVYQRKHQSSPSLAFVRGIHQWPVNSLHKGPVTRKMFPFDDVIMRDDLCQMAFVAAETCRGEWDNWCLKDPYLTHCGLPSNL